jgi:group I intron endonuclease
MKGIYKIVSLTKKVYIGQSHNIENRQNQYRLLKCKAQPKLFNSLTKYGWDNHQFEVIHELPEDVSQDILDKYEQLYMDQYRDCRIELINLREAGSRGKHSEETKLKMKGRITPEETKKKISNTLNGHSFSQETKDKISKTLKTKIKTKEEITTFLNNVQSKEARLKHSLVKTGKKYPKNNRPTKEELKELSIKFDLVEISNIFKTSSVTIKNWLNDYNISYVGKTNEKRKVKIVEKDLSGNILLVFDSKTSAAKYYNRDISSISDRIKNKTIFDSKYLDYY